MKFKLSSRNKKKYKYIMIDHEYNTFNKKQIQEWINSTYIPDPGKVPSMSICWIECIVETDEMHTENVPT